MPRTKLYGPAPAPETRPHALGPNDDTCVPCPVCREGMIAPTIAAHVTRLLERDSAASAPTLYPGPPDDPGQVPER